MLRRTPLTSALAIVRSSSMISTIRPGIPRHMLGSLVGAGDGFETRPYDCSLIVLSASIACPNASPRRWPARAVPVDFEPFLLSNPTTCSRRSMFWKVPPESATAVDPPASRIRSQPATTTSAIVRWNLEDISLSLFPPGGPPRPRE